MKPARLPIVADLLAALHAFVARHLIADDPADTPPWRAPRPPGLHLRQGWETEPVDTGHAWARYVAIVALATLCSVVLSGCGGGGDWEEDAPQDPPPSTQPVDCVATPARCS